MSAVSGTSYFSLTIATSLLFIIWSLSVVNAVERRMDGKNYSDLVDKKMSTTRVKSESSKVPPVFGSLDYAVLGTMLLVSCVIGVFYGFCSGKQETGQDFLLGGSSIGTLPMSLSLAASFITAIELLGNPSEMYYRGTQYWMVCFAFLLAVPITSTFYLPVYMKLRLTSSFEYLEMRFDKYVRFLASFLYVIQMCLYTSVTVYAPALALHDVTGMNVYLAVTLVYIVCIFYSSQGGMKAVIMTDTFQASVLMISLITVAVVGTLYSKGLPAIFQTSSNASRIEFFNTDVSLTVKTTFWTQIIGGTFYWLTMFASNQASVQKYLSVQNISQVKTALWISAFSLILIYTTNFYTGMILFANYHDDDPFKQGKIKKEDEILPYYVMNVSNVYAVPGLFVAGIFAASLGTVATTLNSLAAVVMKDFLGKMFGITITAKKEVYLSKWLSIIFGVISFGFVFVVERMSSVLKAALVFNGLVGGITLGAFSLGMFLPWSNTKGTLVGCLVALVLLSWIGIGAQMVESEVDVADTLKSVEPNNDNNNEAFVLYRISFMWYSVIGFVTTVITGLSFSWITGFNDPLTVHPDLMSPVLQRFYSQLPDDVKENLHLPLEEIAIDNRSVEENLQLVHREPQDITKQSDCCYFDNGRKISNTDG